MTKPLIHFIRLANVSIYEQLQLEEALLRVDNRNWCLVNTGASPAIVMGISGNPSALINPIAFKQNPVPVIRRFSGGGTVFINEETYFVTFICNEESLKVPCNPQSIFRWSETFYNSVFESIDFRLQENDYVSGNKKFGGNAQYLRKSRWLHHTSFLFDYDESQMNLLSFPEKVPTYRKDRHHSDFLCKLNNYFPSKVILNDKIEQSLNKLFDVKEMRIVDIEKLTSEPHRKATAFISCNLN
jgi:lipoate-protein ligase A